MPLAQALDRIKEIGWKPQTAPRRGADFRLTVAAPDAIGYFHRDTGGEDGMPPADMTRRHERIRRAMGFSIALAGKGGTGKTTFSGLLIKYLLKHGKKPILAVDADSNSNLNEVLGLPMCETLGSAREDMKKGNVPSGMTKDVFMSMKMEQSMAEAEGFDLIAMGRPEGAGCYCAANSLLAGFMEKLVDNYPYIVMDNEAGMEHISRLTTKNVDVLLIVADASRRGLQAALRINDLARELRIGVGRSTLVINQVKQPPSAEALRLIQEAGVEYLGTVPEDSRIYAFDAEGRPTIQMPEESPSVRSAFAIFDKIVP
jgi:CO dehydrogenase maturation factor